MTDALDATLDALRTRALAATDGAGYFPAMYARVTQRVIDDIGAGRFDDGARMARFVETFAGRYLDACADPAGAAKCWRGSFDVAADGGLLVVQHLLLGINAHVNFDLPQTVVEAAGPGPLAPIRADFLAVNDILASVYDELLGDLDRVTRWVNVAANIGGGQLFNFSLRTARDTAWATATRLHAASPGGRAAEVGALDELVAVLAYLLTRPVWFVRPIVAVLRHLEARDPVVVTRSLLGPLA